MTAFRALATFFFKISMAALLASLCFLGVILLIGMALQ